LQIGDDMFSFKNPFSILGTLSLSLVLIGGCAQFPANAPVANTATAATPTPSPTYTPIASTVTAMPTPSPTYMPIASTVTAMPTPSPTYTPVPTPQLRLQLTFVSNRHAGFWGIYAIDADFGAQTAPTFSEPKLLFELPYRILSPAWSPDGKRVAFAYHFSKDQLQNVCVADWNGKNLTALTDSAPYEAFPKWSSDGSQIVYNAAQDKGPYQIFIVNADGQGQHQVPIPDNLHDSTHPNWAPDGKQLVFSAHGPANKSLPVQVFSINLDGTQLSQVTHTPDDFALVNLEPMFSPDGLEIVFSGQRMVQKDYWDNILVINRDGTGETDLTNSPSTNIEPKWSPIYDWITFVSDRGGNMDIYLIKPDGTGLVNVTNSRSEDVGPAWRLVSTP
jgi:Tol biopolymer transport system component